MNEKRFNIEHLLRVEQEEAENDIESYPYEDKMDLSQLLLNNKKEEHICTFDPNKQQSIGDLIIETGRQRNVENALDSLNRSVADEVGNNKKDIMLNSMKQFKGQIIHMLHLVDDFFDNFTNELCSNDNNSAEVDDLYRKFLISLDQIKQSMNEIFYTVEESIGKELPIVSKIESLRSEKSFNIENCSKENFFKEKSTQMRLSNFKDSETTNNMNSNQQSYNHDSSTCNNNISTVNYVIDKLISEYKEQNLELKNEVEKLKNKTYVYEGLISSSKRLIDELFCKNKKLTEKLTKYKNYI
jgi:hypothetical protein